MIPTNIFIPRDDAHTRRLVDHLKRHGHNVYVRTKPTDTSNLLEFKWGGGYNRRVHKGILPVGPLHSYMETGYFPHYDSLQLDPLGYCATSTLTSFDIPETTSLQKRELQRWLEEHYLKPTVQLYEDYNYLPLQLFGDTVVKYDFKNNCATSEWYSQLIYKLLDLYPNTKLVVKTHHKSGIAFRGHPRVIVPDFKMPNDELNQSLIKYANRIFSINSTVVLESLVYGKEVITFGNGVFSGRNLTREYPSLDKLLASSESPLSDPTDFLYELIFRRQIAEGIPVKPVWDRYLEEYERHVL